MKGAGYAEFPMLNEGPRHKRVLVGTEVASSILNFGIWYK